MNTNAIHPEFRLNGISFTQEVLKGVACDFIKEGEIHEKAIGEFLCDWLDDSPTLEVQTSGATGMPKRIVLQKLHMVNSALATGKFFDLQAGSSALLCLSADYIAGKMMLIRAMALGLRLDSLAPASNPLREIDKEYDFGAMVPLQLQNSIQKIARIKTLLVGGAPLSTSLKERLKNTPSRIFETYGMTETITHIAVKEIATASTLTEQSETFKALPGVRFSTDLRNCLEIDAPKVTNEQIITNDVVQMISDTEFQWLGRYDNLINSGGVKLHPEQVEKKLLGIIDAPFFVTGIADVVLGEKLVLVIEGEIDVASVLEKIKVNTVLERFEIPKALFTLPQFIMTGSGKIRRKETMKLL
ncbi:AMP-binding protein [Maribacter sp.]|nr:AMP-binding protein [Maribacter sp.]